MEYKAADLEDKVVLDHATFSKRIGHLYKTTGSKIPLIEFDKDVTQPLGITYIGMAWSDDKTEYLGLAFQIIDKEKFFLARIEYGI